MIEQPKCSFNSINTVLITISLIVLPIILIITIYYFTNMSKYIDEGFELDLIPTSTVKIGDAKVNTQDPNDKICNYDNDIYTQNQFGLRQCTVYFTSNIQDCKGDDNTCKYTFDNWWEFDHTKDARGNILSRYPNKIYNPNYTHYASDNFQINAKCFKEITDTSKQSDYEYTANDSVKKDCAAGSTGFHTFNNKNYVSMKFIKDELPPNTHHNNILDAICSVKYDDSNLISALKNRDLFQIKLDADNKIKSDSLIKGRFNAAQTSFVPDNTFRASSFIALDSSGFAYDNDEKKLIVFGTSTTNFDRNIEIYKIKYNYLCDKDSSTPVIELQTYNAKLDLGQLYTFTTTSTRYIEESRNPVLYELKDWYKTQTTIFYDKDNPINKKQAIDDALKDKKKKKIEMIVGDYMKDPEKKRIEETIKNTEDIIEEKKRGKATFEGSLSFDVVNTRMGITRGNYLLNLSEYVFYEGNDYNYANMIRSTKELKYDILNGYLHYRFTDTTVFTLTFDNEVTCELFMIGGGGGAGYNHGGGGGAGAYYHNTNFTFAAGTYTLKVGAGGYGEVDKGAAAQNGEDTYIQKNNTDIMVGTNALRCKGGGGGGSLHTGVRLPDKSISTGHGKNGGCGGGGLGWDGEGGSRSYSGGITNNQGTVGFGYAGGKSTHTHHAGELAGGGGGGIGSAGEDGRTIEGGSGGNGRVFNITGDKEEVFGGGGGGGEWSASAGGPAESPAGLGGGALLSNGRMVRVGGNAVSGGGENGKDGAANTGSGGGAGKGGKGGNGSAGIIIIKIKVDNESETLSRQQILRKTIAIENDNNYVKHPRVALSSSSTTFNNKTIRTKQYVVGCCQGDSWQLFTNNKISKGGPWYHGGAFYTAPSGVASTTPTSFQGYTGDWIMIDLGEAINLKQVKFWPRNHPFNLVSRCPALFRIYATNVDAEYANPTFNANWTLIHDTGTQELTYNIYEGKADGATAIINRNENNIKYKIYLLVVNKLVGGDQHAYIMNFNEWELYADNSVSTTTSAGTTTTVTNLAINLSDDLQRYKEIKDSDQYKDELSCSNTNGYFQKSTADTITISADKFYKYKFISSVFLEAGYYKFRCYLYHTGAPVINSSIMSIETASGNGTFYSVCCFFTKLDQNSTLGNMWYTYNMWTPSGYIYYSKSGFYNICFTCYGYNTHTAGIIPSVKFYYQYFASLPTGSNAITELSKLDVNTESNLSNYELIRNFSITDFANPVWTVSASSSTTSTTTTQVSQRYPREPATSYNYNYVNNNGRSIRIKESSYEIACRDDNCKAWLLFNYPANDAAYTTNSHMWSNCFATGQYYTILDNGYRKASRNIYFKNHTSFNGEWVMIDLGERIVLRYYKIFPMTDTGNANLQRAPRDFRIYATNEDNAWNNSTSLDWVMIDERLNISYTTAAEQQFNISRVSSYRYYAIIVHKNSGNSQPWVQFSKWELYGYPAFQLQTVASTSTPVPFYSYYSKTNRDNINSIYETIYPSRPKESNYEKFKSAIYENDPSFQISREEGIIQTEIGNRDDLIKHYAIKIGEYKLQNQETFSYKGIQSEYDTELKQIDRVKYAFDNMDLSITGEEPQFKGTGINVLQGALLKNNVNQNISQENVKKLITYEKFERSKLTPTGELPNDADKSIYFRLV